LALLPSPYGRRTRVALLGDGLLHCDKHTSHRSGSETGNGRSKCVSKFVSKLVSLGDRFGFQAGSWLPNVGQQYTVTPTLVLPRRHRLYSATQHPVCLCSHSQSTRQQFYSCTGKAAICRLVPLLHVETPSIALGHGCPSSARRLPRYTPAGAANTRTERASIIFTQPINTRIHLQHDTK
jgi:hypothetical protein